VIVVEIFEFFSKNENKSLEIFMNKVEMNNAPLEKKIEEFSNP
jgi:hypothetical protein